MSNVPQDLRYTREHEWARSEDEVIRIGITDYAQEQLGDVVYLNLPEVGSTVTGGEPCGEVESTKSVSDIYAPVGGEVVEVNAQAMDNTAVVNQDPYRTGWLFAVRPSDPAAIESLLSADDYSKLLHEEAGEEAH